MLLPVWRWKGPREKGCGQLLRANSSSWLTGHKEVGTSILQLQETKVRQHLNELESRFSLPKPTEASWPTPSFWLCDALSRAQFHLPRTPDLRDCKIINECGIKTLSLGQFVLSLLKQTDTVRKLPGYSLGKYLWCSKAADSKVLYLPCQDAKLFLWTAASTECLSIRDGRTDKEDMSETETQHNQGLQVKF